MRMCGKCIAGGEDGDKSTITNNTQFYCCGGVPPRGHYRSRHGMLSACSDDDLGDFETIEAASEAFESLGTVIINNPDVPHIAALPEQLFIGRTIEFRGTVLHDACRFSVNLAVDIDESSDLGLHFNPRFDRRVVIRNHRYRRKWGDEEIATFHKFPFIRGKSFHLAIFVADEQFLVSVNYVHFCAFTFRVRLEDLKYLLVTGDITLTSITHMDLLSYPHLCYRPNAPFVVIPRYLKKKGEKCEIRKKVKQIQIGTVIEITGRVTLMPQTFYINIQSGVQRWPHPVIALHLNPRFRGPHAKVEQEVIINSWYNGSWSKEDKRPENPFVPGKKFELIIACATGGFSIVVDGKPYHTYPYRTFNGSDTLLVEGDVVIQTVRLRPIEGAKSYFNAMTYD